MPLIPTLFFSILLLTLGYLVFSTVLVFVPHQRRHIIHYGVFDRKVKYYKVRLSSRQVTILLSHLIISSAIITSIILSQRWEYSGFILPLALSVFGAVAVQYVWYHMISQNRNLSYFEKAHASVTEALKSQSNAEKSHKEMLKHYAMTETFLKELSAPFLNLKELDIARFNDVLNPLKTLIDQQDTSLRQFSSQVVKQFDEALNQYLNHQIRLDIQASKHISAYASDFEQCKTVIDNDWKQKYEKALIVYMKSGYVADYQTLDELLQTYMTSNIATSDSLNSALMDFIHSHAQGRTTAINEYIKCNMLDYAMLSSHMVKRGASWFIDEFPMTEKAQVIQTANDLVNENAHRLTLNFVIKHHDSIVRYQQDLQQISIQNKAKSLIDKGINKERQQDNFFQDAKRYENVNHAVLDYIKTHSVKSPHVNRILSLKEAFANRELLDEMYNEFKRNHQSVDDLAQLVGLLVDEIQPDHQLFDEQKLVVAMNGYKDRLLYDELLVMSALLAAYILRDTNDEHLVKTLLRMLNENVKELKFNANKDFTLYSPKTKEKAAKDLLNQLTTKHHDTLKSVVLGIEKKRLTIDSIENMFS